MKKLLFVGTALCASACFAVTDDVSDLHPAPPPPGLTMRFYGMEQHVPQLFDFKIIDSKSNFVQTHGKILPLRMAADDHGTFRIYVPYAIPDGATGYRVDFWANMVDYDPDHTGKVNVYEFDHAWAFGNLDHSWRVLLDNNVPSESHAVVTHVNDGYSLTFNHFYNFTDLNRFPDDGHLTPNPPTDTGADAVIQLKNVTALEGKLAQIRVTDPSSGRVVGLYRFVTTSAPVEWRIEGCVEQLGYYDVDLYIDANGNNDSNGKGYDDPSKGPGNDLGWRFVNQRAGMKELSVTFDAADTASGNVNVGEL